MANIELTTATQTQLSEIAATLSPPVLSSLPAVTASKAGELFYYNGTLWTYAKTGQFGTLAEGTPWPVKGYKDIVIYYDPTDQSAMAGLPRINDAGWTIDGITPLAGGTGIRIFSSDIPSGNNMEIKGFGYDNPAGTSIPGAKGNVTAGDNILIVFDAAHLDWIANGDYFTTEIRIYPPKS